MTHTCELYRNEELLFYSDAHWLHPLMELDDFLKDSDLKPEELVLKDKIIGRAAALLIARMRIGQVEALTLSTPGAETLKHFGIPFTAQKHIERVQCATEEILLNETDPEKAYEFIRWRIASRSKSY